MWESAPHTEGKERHRHRLPAPDAQAWQAEARAWQLQYLLCHSFVQALSRSLVWRLLRPVRAARELLRPRGFTQGELIPWQQLEPDREAAPGTWQATGPEPAFVVPCVLPRGWLRVRLRLTTEVAGRLELSDLGGHGVADSDCLKQLEVQGRVEREEYVYLRRPALGLRLNPLNTVGRFQLHALEVTPVPRLVIGWQALGRKWTALRRYGLVKRALLHGVGLLLRGRLGEFAAKVQDGLHWARQPVMERAPADEHPAPVTVRTAGMPLPRRTLDIVYVLKGVGLCGGVRVVLEHLAGLQARGHRVVLYYLGGSLEGLPRPARAIQFDSVEALKAALRSFRGIKVASWYETAPWVVDSLQPGERGYYLVQDIEASYGTRRSERQAALATYGLKLRLITEGTWVQEQLRQQFGRDSLFVSIGLDLECFRPLALPRAANRILTQARTWSGGGAAGARLKGWETARQVVERCFQRNPQTALTTFGLEPRPACAAGLPHQHVQGASDPALARLYNAAGLYLLTSSHEGFGLTAAEAMACGCPVVATYAQGNEEFCRHGETALMAPAGDVEQLTHHCLTLQADPALAAHLAQNGRAVITTYTWKRVIDRLEQAFLEDSGVPARLAADDEPALPKEDPGRPPSSEVELEPVEEAMAAVPLGDSEYPDLHVSDGAALDCTIVIPTINDYQMVVQCITSCRRHLPADADVEFRVVDDGTRDRGILEALHQAAKELDFQLLRNHQNLGFSASVNHGMRRARGRVVLLCNNDIVFFQPWLESLEEAFAANVSWGIVGARLLYPNGTIQHAGVDKLPGQLRWQHAYGGWPGDHPRALQSRAVWSVTGALFAVRREVLRRLGGFSTAYTTAYEDLDYCLHACSQGIRVGYWAELAAYHHEGKTRGASSDQKQQRPLLWAERERAGSVYFEKKWAALRTVEEVESLLPRPRRTTARGSLQTAT